MSANFDSSTHRTLTLTARLLSALHLDGPLFVGLLAICAAVLTGGPAQAHDTGVPHLIHEYEGWVALGVVVLAITGAGLLVRRALRR